jgi:hypothetical protein
MKFTFVGGDVQLTYSPARQALGEWQRWPSETGGSTWHFVGWLWAGEIKSERQARRYTKRYLELEAKLKDSVVKASDV